jgi:3',5'-cyclic-AMP phosphodiesterase
MTTVKGFGMAAWPMLVQLTDPHIVPPGRLLAGAIDTPALLAQAVAAAIALRPEAVVMTGDLVERGTADEYEHLRGLIAPLSCPVWLMPGNHDDIPTLRAAFPDHPELAQPTDPALAPFVLWQRDLGGMRLVALDSTVPRRPHGALCPQRLAWLHATLAAAPDVPTLVAMHHPPFATGIAHMDAMGLREGAAALEAVLRHHPQVERVICGHLHRAISCRFGGTLVMTAPSTAHQIALVLTPGSPAAWRREPPGMAVHLRVGDTVVSHLATTGDHGPIEPY